MKNGGEEMKKMEVSKISERLRKAECSYDTKKGARQYAKVTGDDGLWFHTRRGVPVVTVVYYWFATKKFEQTTSYCMMEGK
jgi:hypothetical protein